MKRSSLQNFNYSIQHFSVVIIALLIIFMSTSCGSVKNFQYLQGSFDTARLSKVNIPEPVVQKGDLLGITVYSDDPLATAAVTRQPAVALPTSSTGDNSSFASQSGAATGFLVNQKGDLELYKLGNIRAEGLTKDQLADTIETLYSKQGLLKNPYVEVRFLNYKITIIGEVSKPGSFTVPTDKLSAFEAIALAGDITVYGRRDNILVIRESNGARQFGTLNLKDPNVLQSPYYYLQQNDMLVVDVGKNKSVINNQNAYQTISIGASIISITAVIISLIRSN